MSNGTSYKIKKIDWLGWKGWNEVRKSQPVVALVRQKAQEWADRAGDGYTVEHYGASRFLVIASNSKAEQDNLENNTLLKTRR